MNLDVHWICSELFVTIFFLCIECALVANTHSWMWHAIVSIHLHRNYAYEACIRCGCIRFRCNASSDRFATVFGHARHMRIWQYAFRPIGQFYYFVYDDYILLFSRMNDVRVEMQILLPFSVCVWVCVSEFVLLLKWPHVWNLHFFNCKMQVYALKFKREQN